jgi:hypothetical protein
MNKNRHLLQEERSIIEQRLTEKKSFKSISRELLKDPTTIAKEVRNHIQFRKTGCYGKPFNNCLIRKCCTVRHICGNRKCNRYCNFCNAHPYALTIIRKYAPDFQSLPMSAMAVKTEGPAHWKKEFTLQLTHKGNMRQSVPNPVRGYSLPKRKL